MVCGDVSPLQTIFHFEGHDMTDTTTTTIDIPGYKAGTWVLDPAHSEVTFSVRHMMISQVRGVFGVKSATSEAGENPLDTKVTASVDVASVDTKDEGRDAHLRSADFFDAEANPTITFRSTEVRLDGGEDLALAGDLTINGVTRPVELDVEYNGSAVDPWGNPRVGFSGVTEVSRKDFGLTWNVALEAGGVLVGDKAKIAIEVSAVKQPDA